LGGVGTTVENLEAARSGENYETIDMYPQFAEEAEAEGNTAAAVLFKMIGKIEAHHRERYEKLLDMVQNGTVFKREEPIKWKCSVCGFTVEGTEPPPKCPACKNPKEFYEPADLDF
jgi:rubrerythrin